MDRGSLSVSPPVPQAGWAWLAVGCVQGVRGGEGEGVTHWVLAGERRCLETRSGPPSVVSILQRKKP